MKIYVYAIWFPTSKRLNPYYIGIAENLEQRMFAHLRNKSFVGKALRKYDDWIIKNLHTCKTYGEAFRIEIEEIRNFNCVAPNGYNLTAGGDGGDTFTNNPNKEEIRKNMQKARKGNQNAKGKNLGNQYASGKRSEEFRKKCKKNKNHQGKKHSKEFCESLIDNKYGQGKRSKEFCEKYKGNKYALKHGEYTKEAKIKKLREKIVKLERETNGN